VVIELCQFDKLMSPCYLYLLKANYLNGGSLKNIAGVLGKSQRTVRRYCEDGLIPKAYRSVTGKWRVSRLGPSEITLIFFRIGRLKLGHGSDMAPEWAYQLWALADSGSKTFEAIPDDYYNIYMWGDFDSGKITNSEFQNCLFEKEKDASEPGPKRRAMELEGYAWWAKVAFNSITVSNMARKAQMKRANFYKIYGRREIRKTIAALKAKASPRNKA